MPVRGVIDAIEQVDVFGVDDGAGRRGAARRGRVFGQRGHRRERERTDADTGGEPANASCRHGNSLEGWPRRHQRCLARDEIVRRRSTRFMRPLARSEEHTSELQSLTPISYAVFCLQTQTHRMWTSTAHENTYRHP